MAENGISITRCDECKDEFKSSAGNPIKKCLICKRPTTQIRLDATINSGGD